MPAELAHIDKRGSRRDRREELALDLNEARNAFVTACGYVNSKNVFVGYALDRWADGLDVRDTVHHVTEQGLTLTDKAKCSDFDQSRDGRQLETVRVGADCTALHHPSNGPLPFREDPLAA